MGERESTVSGERPLWSGRFTAAPDADMLRLTRSIETDLHLLPWDCEATIAHARGLNRAGLIDDSDLESIAGACRQIVEEWERGELEVATGDEDVHTLVERLLTERLGEAGRRIHAGRSRNDLVATDLRLWCREAAAARADDVERLVATIVDLAEEHLDTVLPGYTHLQRAQPVTLAFHLVAHGFAFARDLARLRSAASAADVSVLGAGALAGTTLQLDPAKTAEDLGFSSLFQNAADAVADRDFVCDLVYACALAGVHLSRLAEEVVLWTTAEFGFARLADEWSTGSSMMPQKRNPDMAELVRGRAAGGIADLGGLLTLIKGLPLTYNRDLQEDKRYVFAAVDRLSACLSGMTALLETITFDPEAMARAAGDGALWATDVAERMVGSGIPFRDAHERVARMVARAEEEGESPWDAPAPHESVGVRSGRGGPAPDEVRRQLAALRGAVELGD